MRVFYFFISIVFFFPVSAQDFKEKAHVLQSSASLDALIAAAASKKLVMLGDASHGTHEYYVWRDAISRRLIEEHEFNFIVVEGDFASLYKVNRYVKKMPDAARSARKVLARLERWPEWMWANEEVVTLIEWLRAHNDKLTPEQRVGFYGMDVYDEGRSRREVLAVLKKHQRDLYREVRKEYSCFSPYKNNSWAYAKAVQQGADSCADAAAKVVQLVEQMQLVDQKRKAIPALTDHQYFYVQQNAGVVRSAEKFYRETLVLQDESSWNSRVAHMHSTIDRLLTLHGEDAKGIVWAHNTHVGDASYTTMLQSNHQNIGRLARKQWGRDNVFLVGFTTYTGSVLAGSTWGGPMATKQIPPAKSDSLEEKLYRTELEAFYLIFDEEDRDDDAMLAPVGHREIGAVYNPADDHDQYEPSILPLRYDTLMFFATTRALEPID